jgi:hypothetical protein
MVFSYRKSNDILWSDTLWFYFAGIFTTAEIVKPKAWRIICPVPISLVEVGMRLK